MTTHMESDGNWNTQEIYNSSKCASQLEILILICSIETLSAKAETSEYINRLTVLTCND